MRKQSAYARKRSQHAQACTYSILTELSASPTEPMPLQRRSYQLTRMWQGLTAIERAPEPTKDDWRVCSDAVIAASSRHFCGTRSRSQSARAAVAPSSSWP